MNQHEFEKVCAKLNSERTAIIAAKRPEYTEGNVDVFHNFKTVALELGLDPIQIWYVYFRKHIASISSYCSNPTRDLAEPINSRIADAMNYLELLMGMIQEKKNDEIPF